MIKLIDTFHNFVKASFKKKREEESKVCADSNREKKHFLIPNAECLAFV